MSKFLKKLSVADAAQKYNDGKAIEVKRNSRSGHIIGLINNPDENMSGTVLIAGDNLQVENPVIFLCESEEEDKQFSSNPKKVKVGQKFLMFCEDAGLEDTGETLPM